MSMFIRPNPPGIMQSTTRLTPIQLYRALHKLEEHTSVLDWKGKPVQVSDDTTDLRPDHEIQVINEDELRVRIVWTDWAGYTIYTMTCNMRARNPTHSQNGREDKFIAMTPMQHVVPDCAYVLGTIADARTRIRRESERLKTRSRSSR